MKLFTYSQVQENLTAVLTLAQEEEVEIRAKDGSTFLLRSKRQEPRSPLDVPGIDCGVTTTDILDAIRESRER